MFGEEILLQKEVGYMEYVLPRLSKVPGLTPLLQKIDSLRNENGLLTVQAKPFLFEARLAYESLKNGVQPQYEYKAGVGETSIDFKIGSSPEFLIEAVSLGVTQGAKAAKVQRNDGYVTFNMSSHKLRSGNGRERETPENEVISAQGKLYEKVFADGKETKFPQITEENSIQVICADVRGLMGGGDSMEHNRQMVSLIMCGHTGGAMPTRMNVSTDKSSYEPLYGIFEEGCSNHKATLIRERIHGIHFICESDYTEGHIFDVGSSGHFIWNPNLIRSNDHQKEVYLNYPFMNAATRRYIMDTYI